METLWAEEILTARGYRIERLETQPHKRLLFRIDDLFLFPDELHALAEGTYSLEELRSKKNAMDYL